MLRGDRGAVSVELVLATPLLLLMLLAIVQFALWSHATHIAQAAASQGLAAARTQDATASDGFSAAQRVLDQLGAGPLTNGSIAVNRDSTIASVHVTGEASTVIPLLHLPVHAEAAVRWNVSCPWQEGDRVCDLCARCGFGGGRNGVPWPSRSPCSRRVW